MKAQRLFGRFERRRNRRTDRRGFDDGVERLETVTRDDRDNRFVTVDRASVDHLAQRGNRDPAGRFGEDPFSLGEQTDAFENLGIGH